MVFHCNYCISDDLPLSPFGIMYTTVFVEVRFHERVERWCGFGQFSVGEYELSSGEDLRQGVQVQQMVWCLQYVSSISHV